LKPRLLYGVIAEATTHNISHILQGPNKRVIIVDS
jgi:hypothetical protein